MPIRINLLSEAIAAEDLRRRDPVKRAIFIGLLLVAGSLVWYSSTWLGSMMSKESLNHVEAEIETHTNDYAHVMDNTKKIADVQRKLGALKQLNAERFLQGNLLNALQQTYVPKDFPAKSAPHSIVSARQASSGRPRSSWYYP